MSNLNHYTRACILGVLWAISYTAMAQDTIIPLWGNAIPNRVISDEVEVSERNGILRISRVQVPEIAVYLPDVPGTKSSGIVIFPGGGYHILAYEWEGTEIAEWLNTQGVAAFVVKYRLPVSESIIRPHEVPLMDAQRAVRLVRSKARQWGLSADRIGVMGFSAGGHLAASLGTLYNLPVYSPQDGADTLSARPDFMALIYPVITFSGAAVHQGSRRALLGEDPGEELVIRYSPERQVTAQTPPTFLLHAMDDNGVPPENSLLFYQALLDKGVAGALHIFPEGGHGFSMAKDHPVLNQWTGLFTTWLANLDLP